MRKVYKYPLQIRDYQSLRLPLNAQILSVGEQGDNIYLWALIDPVEDAHEDIKIRIAGTGHPIESSDDGFCKIKQFLGTVHLNNSELIFHVFEVK